jgi:DNA-binding transcriptional MerR regulator
MLLAKEGETTENEQSYSMGEASNATGLSSKTFQYYDNIGLMPASGKTESGRQFYTGSDVM